MLRRWTLDNAALFIFSSPPQMEDVRRRYPFDRPTKIMPVPVNLEPFKEAARPMNERQGAVFVGRVDVFKGAPTAIDWAIRTETALTIIGDNRYMKFGQLPPWIKIAGQIPYERMPQVLGKAKTYIAVPEWPEAFGRSVAEAWAAGCELRLEGKIGAQWWIENEPERLGHEGPVNEFWDAVGEVVGC